MIIASDDLKRLRVENPFGFLKKVVEISDVGGICKISSKLEKYVMVWLRTEMFVLDPIARPLKVNSSGNSCSAIFSLVINNGEIIVKNLKLSLPSRSYVTTVADQDLM